MRHSSAVYPLRNMWMRRGQQIRVPTPLQNDTLCSYGALELDTGHMVTSYSFERPDSDTMIAYLEDVLSEYPEQDIILIWDTCCTASVQCQATFHTPQATEAWLAEHDWVHVYLLPKYPPQLNPLETLWQHLKNCVAANLTRLGSVDVSTEPYKNASEVQKAQVSTGQLVESREDPSVVLDFVDEALD